MRQRSLKVKVICLNSDGQETQLFSCYLSIKEKCLPCYHLGDWWVPYTGSESLHMDRSQEQSHLIIKIHSDHETYFGKVKKKMFTHLQIPMILNKTTAFPFISRKTCDVQRGRGRVQLGL
jgi:hypothetical protein